MLLTGKAPSTTPAMPPGETEVAAWAVTAAVMAAQLGESTPAVERNGAWPACSTVRARAVEVVGTGH